MTDYIYRYDSWLSHMKLHGDMLRARFWSTKERDSWKHEPLLAAEKELTNGEGLFRISFWKNLDAAVNWMGAGVLHWTELHVLQRVCADHPFFAAFHKVDDDFLTDTAWLYWQKVQRNPEQEWSSEGIPKSDIEVLDFDGQWRRFSESAIMETSHIRLSQLSFRPHYFTTHFGRPEVVYWRTIILPQSSGDSVIALLIQHPYESELRIYNDNPVIQEIVNQFRRFYAPGVPADKIRLFVLDEGKYTYDRSHLLEIPLKGRWIETKHGSLRWRLPFFRSASQSEYEIAASNDGWKWHNDKSDLWQSVISLSNVHTQKCNLVRYQSVLNGMFNLSNRRLSRAA